jgi:hypothetical protein
MSLPHTVLEHIGRVLIETRTRDVFVWGSHGRYSVEFDKNLITPGDARALAALLVEAADKTDAALAEWQRLIDEKGSAA